jgi:hypothetical protein
VALALACSTGSDETRLAPPEIERTAVEPAPVEPAAIAPAPVQPDPVAPASSEPAVEPAPVAPAPAEAPTGAVDPARVPAAAGASGLTSLLATCEPVQFAAVRPGRLGRRPYLQKVGATSASVVFTTRELDTDPRLALSHPGAALLGIVSSELDPADATGHQRVFRLSGLEPDTVYCYQIEDWTQPLRFRTAPRAGAGARVRFVAFGDSGGSSRDMVSAEVQRAAFDLLLHTGDIAYDSGELADFEAKFFDTYANVLEVVPVFPASGNHDYRVDDAATFRQVFALPENGGPAGVERWFSFDWGDVHFVALDTERVGSEQSAWLDADLASNALPWTVVYMHKPPYSSGAHGSSLDVRDAFSPIFERHGVQLVLSGHDHDYERTRPIGGVTYVVTGGGGYGLRPVGQSDFTVLSASVFHFVRAEVEADTLALIAIDATGATVDSVRIPRRSEPR